MTTIRRPSRWWWVGIYGAACCVGWGLCGTVLTLLLGLGAPWFDFTLFLLGAWLLHVCVDGMMRRYEASWQAQQYIEEPH